jgi:hypothetical protein
MRAAAVEEVLCVKRDEIFPDGAWHGFVTDDLDRYRAIIRERYVFKPRAEVEDDPGFQQIIPYVVFRHGDRYFLTHRLRASSEKRLRKQYSLGIGGHINPGDLRSDPGRAQARVGGGGRLRRPLRCPAARAPQRRVGPGVEGAPGHRVPGRRRYAEHRHPGDEETRW